MALSIKHAFQSNKTDSPDSTKVRPSDWNAEHVITLAANKVVGRGNTPGAAEEVDFTALARQLAACASIADFAAVLGIVVPTTGDVFMSMRNTAPPGWLKFDDGTIGPAGSAATSRANNDCENLYKLIWETVPNEYAPVTGGRGGSAAADWGAGKPIALLRACGRVLGVAGAGVGLTARGVGVWLGEEEHALTEEENGPHTHTGTTNVAGAHTHSVTVGWPVGQAPFSSGSPQCGTQTVNTSTAGNHQHTFTTNQSGEGVPHNTMQPTLFLNAFIKL